MEFYWIGFAVTFGQYYVQRVVACDTVQARIFLIKLISLNKTWMIFQFWINRTVGKHLFLEVFYLGLLAHSLYHFWVSQFRVNSFANFKTNQQLFFNFMKEITFWALAFYRHCDPVISGWGLIPENLKFQLRRSNTDFFWIIYLISWHWFETIVSVNFVFWLSNWKFQLYLSINYVASTI